MKTLSIFHETTEYQNDAPKANEIQFVQLDMAVMVMQFPSVRPSLAHYCQPRVSHLREALNSYSLGQCFEQRNIQQTFSLTSAQESSFLFALFPASSPSDVSHIKAYEENVEREKWLCIPRSFIHNWSWKYKARRSLTVRHRTCPHFYGNMSASISSKVHVTVQNMCYPNCKKWSVTKTSSWWHHPIEMKLNCNITPHTSQESGLRGLSKRAVLGSIRTQRTKTCFKRQTRNLDTLCCFRAFPTESI